MQDTPTSIARQIKSWLLTTKEKSSTVDHLSWTTKLIVGRRENSWGEIFLLFFFFLYNSVRVLCRISCVSLFSGLFLILSTSVIVNNNDFWKEFCATSRPNWAAGMMRKRNVVEKREHSTSGQFLSFDFVTLSRLHNHARRHTHHTHVGRVVRG